MSSDISVQCIIHILTDKLGGNVFAKIENDTLTISLEIK